MENTTDIKRSDLDIRNDKGNAFTIYVLASFFTMFKVGNFLYQYYFPVFVPIGTLGNILSFLVMIQSHNRHMSMSWYLAALSFVDTIVLAIALVTYLAAVHHVYFPPNAYWYCNMADMAVFSAFLCSTFLLVAMTFDRFYSIVRPHKAASFNTVKRAKITIACVVIFSITYNVPHLFISDHDKWQCIPYGKAMNKSYGQFYYWCSFALNYALPFVLLLAMNSVIIHKIRKRKRFSQPRQHEQGQGQGQIQGQGQGQIQGQGQSDDTKMRSSEGQIYAILLLVTFGFLILVTPAYMFFLFVMLVNFFASPKRLAGYHLFYNVAHKLQTTNHGINFFFYVVSGQKFRSDLMNLFGIRKQKKEASSSKLTENSSVKTK